MAIGKEGNVKWVDGLRGLASTLVVLTHLARAFDHPLFFPSDKEDVPPRLMQWPFLRVLPQGRIGVSIFAFVTGYVCALKPIKLCRQGNQEAAMASIGKSALRRVPRLILPTTFITAIIWLVAQFGVFTVAKRTDSMWVNYTSPDMVPFLGSSIKSLVYHIITTWTRAQNMYDGNQWTLLPLLRGSMLVYVFMVATAYVAPKYRMMGAMGMWLYYYLGNESTFGMQFFWGVFMADLQNHPQATQWLTKNRLICRVLTVIFLILGLYLASYPEAKWEYMAWSKGQHHFLERILPKDPDYPRFATGLGLELISLGLHFSPGLRELLSNKYFLWLGKQSFAVYLLHGVLIRTVLVWMLYGFSIPADVKNEKGEIIHPRIPFPGKLRLAIALPFWLPLNYGAAMLWTTYVDPWCAKQTETMVAYILNDGEKTSSPLPS